MSIDDIFYRKYFAGLLELMEGAGIQVQPRTAYGGQFQIIYSWPGRKDIAANILTTKQEIRVDLTLKSEDAHTEYLILENERSKIEQIIGKELEWNPNPRNERQIIWRLQNTDPTDVSDWPKQHAWLAARLISFRLAFGPIIEAWEA